jgi:hypothetical protein
VQKPPRGGFLLLGARESVGAFFLVIANENEPVFSQKIWLKIVGQNNFILI